MNTLTKLIDLKYSLKLLQSNRGRGQTWRGVDLFITNGIDMNGFVEGDEIIVHPFSADVVYTFKRVLKIIMDCEDVGYDFLNKYDIIRNLVQNLPAINTAYVLIGRALKLVLTARHTRFYLAYGSNMIRSQMLQRCPKSQYICNSRIDGYRFMINSRGFATIVESPGQVVEVAIFEVSNECENTLDRYEGVGLGLYYKEKTHIPQFWINGFVYKAADITETFCPRPGYLEGIIEAAKSIKLGRAYVSFLENYLDRCIAS